MQTIKDVVNQSLGIVEQEFNHLTKSQMRSMLVALTESNHELVREIQLWRNGRGDLVKRYILKGGA